MPDPPVVPGTYVEELAGRGRAITGARTAVTAFVGALDGLAPGAQRVFWSQAHLEHACAESGRGGALGLALRQYFGNGGGTAVVIGCAPPGPDPAARLLDALAAITAQSAIVRDAAAATAAGDDAPRFDLLCVPEAFDLPQADALRVTDAASRLCEGRRAFCIADVPRAVSAAHAAQWAAQLAPSTNAALYLPALRIGAPGSGAPVEVAPSGTIAGLYARTDATRGVYKAPAGTDASLVGVLGLAEAIDDTRGGELNRLGINTLREFPGAGVVAWGARTMAGADANGSDWRYVPVRRLALHIERSLLEGTQWAVIEPNDEALWSQLRLDVGAFMQGLFRQGAFQGTTSRDAYFVRCDAGTTTAADIANRVVNIEIGFAPLKPAEFLILRIRQSAGSAPG
jgi:phage tail sheath protein FI